MDFLTLLEKVLFTLPGGYDVSLITLVVFCICLVTILVALFVIISDIKKYPTGKKPTRKERREQKRAQRIDKKNVRSPQPVAAPSNKKLSAPNPANDPLIRILGFDPYAPVQAENYFTGPEFVDVEQETDDMRALREKLIMRDTLEQKRKAWSERLEKVRYELDKTSHYLRENSVVLSSTATVGEKIQSRIYQLNSSKKSARENKDLVNRLTAEYAQNDAAVKTLQTTIGEKTKDEKLLSEANQHIITEIARIERELTIVKQDIERLKATVGVEIERIEMDNRARTLMAKYSALRPLLYSVNITYREINKLDVQLKDIASTRTDLRAKLNAEMQALQSVQNDAQGGALTLSVNDINTSLIALDAKENEIVNKKDELIKRFRAAKDEANTFLNREKYMLEDIIVAEDKVVGEIEHEALKAEYEAKRVKAAEACALAQRDRDELVARKEKSKKKYHGELTDQIVMAESMLFRAQQDLEKATADYDGVLPTLLPASLVKSGSGVISRERIASETGNKSKLYPVKATKSAEKPAAKKTETKKPAAKKTTKSEQLDKLVSRLDQLENIARNEKTKRQAVAKPEKSAPAPELAAEVAPAEPVQASAAEPEKPVEKKTEKKAKKKK